MQLVNNQDTGGQKVSEEWVILENLKILGRIKRYLYEKGHNIQCIETDDVLDSFDFWIPKECGLVALPRIESIIHSLQSVRPRLKPYIVKPLDRKGQIRNVTHIWVHQDQQYVYCFSYFENSSYIPTEQFVIESASCKIDKGYFYRMYKEFKS